MKHHVRLTYFHRPFTAHILILSLLPTFPALASSSLIACAIRWDALYTNGEADPARYTAAALSPSRFHNLAPLHAQFDKHGDIQWKPSQITFDAEIVAAHNAGLCWAYMMYGTSNMIVLNNPMMKALALHRASIIKKQVQYAIILPISLLGTSESFHESTNAILNLLLDSNYQRVNVDGKQRPLIFLLNETNESDASLTTSLAYAKRSIKEIRELSVRHGRGNPYIVVLATPARKAETVRLILEADAISEYVSGARKPGIQTWANFEPTIESDWDEYAGVTKGAIVPTLRSGADIRARCETPPPFEHRFPQGFSCENFYVRNPSLAELHTEFSNARIWIDAHADKDPPKALLIYAWSECDESGNCLMPTYGDPRGRKLYEINSALR